MALYIHSLEKLLGLKLRLLLPGHGLSIPDPYGKINEYIQHRLMREREILQSLQEGLRTIPSIAARIYTDIAAPLTSMAQLSVEAHLIKLIKEGRVRREGENYVTT
jgi:glyoxylase-like metal-dependent hydrolase (beta-lactamase superfamily II)